MPALIFAARALLSRATLSHNGVELAPAFPLAPGHIIVSPRRRRHDPVSNFCPGPLNYSGLGCVHFTSGRTTELF